MTKTNKKLNKTANLPSIRVTPAKKDDIINTFERLDLNVSDIVRNHLDKWVNNVDMLEEKLIKDKTPLFEIVFDLPSIATQKIPVVYDDRHKSNILRVVSAKSEISVGEQGTTLIISRTSDYLKFASILKQELKKGDLILLGKGSKVIGRVNNAYTTIRKVLEDSWKENKTRLSITDNSQEIIDITSRKGWNRVVQEARQDSERRATNQYIKKDDTSRITSPLNYYLRELDTLEVALEKTFRLIFQYKDEFLSLTNEDIEKIAKNVYSAIMNKEHGIYKYSFKEIREKLYELKNKVDQIGVTKELKLCAGCKIEIVGKSAQYCKECFKKTQELFN